MIRPYDEHDIDDLLDVWYRASLVAHFFLPHEFFETERVEDRRTLASGG